MLGKILCSDLHVLHPECDVWYIDVAILRDQRVLTRSHVLHKFEVQSGTETHHGDMQLTCGIDTKSLFQIRGIFSARTFVEAKEKLRAQYISKE